MLARHIVGYAPSLIVAALVSFASVSLFTSLMSQSEYGQFALTISAMTMLVGVGFFWLQSASSRLLLQAIADGKEERFVSTLYGIAAATSFFILAIAALIIAIFDLGDWRIAAWFAAPLAILRSLLNLNQTIHRSFVHIARYNIIEIGQAVIGLGASAALILCLHRGAAGAATGAMLGLAAMLVFDWRTLSRFHWREVDWTIFREVTHFGMPFIVTYGLSFVLSGSDRFLIEYFLGPEQVGIYAAGYAFPDRIGQNLFMAVATASFPLVVRRLEQEGTEAARDQTYINGVAILSLAIPACVGLLLVNRQIAAVLIGPAFRAGAVMIMPWIAVATIFNGIAAHYFDHALHLAKKTRLFFYTLGPAALLNFGANLYAIPHFGIIGAAYTTLAAYALYLALSVAVGRRVFQIKFPFIPALQVGASAAFMALIILILHAPETIGGLVTNIAVGGVAYTMGVLFFNVMGLRELVKRKIGSRAVSLSTADLHFEILTSFSALEGLAPEWRALYHRTGNYLFGSFEWFQIWWKHLGQSSGTHLQVAIARASSGDLKAIMPLATRRSGFWRVSEWAGYEVFDYGDVLAVDASDADALCQFMLKDGHRDIVLLKDIHAGALSLPSLTKYMCLREQRANYFLTLDFPTGEAWLAAQSRKLRGDTRRKTEKMQARGPVAFHVHDNTKPLPDALLDVLYKQKLAWVTDRAIRGVFGRAEMKDFLRELAQKAAQEGRLYLGYLTCGTEIVAGHMGFIFEGVLYLYITTYDAAFGAFSPGNALMIETIKWAIDQRLRELDFMRGDEAYKQRFASGTRNLSALVVGTSRIGRMLILLRSLRRTHDSKSDPSEEKAET